MLTQREQRKAAKEFAERWKGIGYEKGDSGRFWMSLLNEVYGVERPAEFIRFEDKVMLDNTSFIDGYIPSTHVLIEQKSIDKDLRKGIRQSDGSVLSPFQQAKRYSIELPYDDRPRWIVLSNFKEFHIYDMNNPQSEAEVVYLKDLEEDYYRMNFLVNEEDHYIKKATEVSIQAGELVGILYDALLRQYKNPKDEGTLKDLNVLCVRLVFCFYAEDAGLFGRHNMFHDYLRQFDDNPSSFRDALIKLFKVLDQKEQERDPYQSEELLAFPYVNGGLFGKENVVIPRINDEIIDIILNKASANFDWSQISPTIFGGVFESTLNPDIRRSGGMHYTSIENIHKVIDPLFMDELREEFKVAASLKTISTKKRRLEELQNKMASLKFLDPAAGSGNFLTETYISLRKLENEILKELYGQQIVMKETHNPIKVSISQFYGIEINDFAVSVARTALWIAESQMMKQTEDIVNMNLDFLPLKSYPNIVEGNSLRIDWEEVVPKEELNYIMGNPPFLGARLMSASQREDIYNLFDTKKRGNLDYVTGWFKKAFEFIKNSSIEVSFVSTSSISEGELVSIVWKDMFNEGLKINFAYRPFKWVSEASDSAQVYVVIIGFTHLVERNVKNIYEEGMFKKVQHINAYLIDAPDIFVERRSKPISDIPKLHKGCQPTDGGNLIIEDYEIDSFVRKEPRAKKYIKKLIGATEFIKNKNRYCLWLVNADLTEIKSMPLVMQRIQKTKEMRLAANSKGTRKLAERPNEFRETYNYDNYLVIPRHSTSSRKYIPMGYFGKDVISTDSNLITQDAEIYLFGVLHSNVHMSWVKLVSGRLGIAYRYSAGVVYNNFPWPSPTLDQKNKIEKTAQSILNVRKELEKYSLDVLYDDTIMPSKLRKAHQENDKAVMEAYGFDWRTMTESECVAELMKLYQKLVD